MLGRFLDHLLDSNFLLRDLTNIIYSKGERGPPCLSPLLALKKVVDLPFTNEAIQGELMQAKFHRIKGRHKTKFEKKIMLDSIKNISHI